MISVHYNVITIMSSMIVSKTKPTFIYTKNQALVMLEDGIWRVSRGALGNGTFICEQDGYQYVLDEGSFRMLYDDTSIKDAENIVIQHNIDRLNRNYNLKVPQFVQRGADQVR